MSSFNLHYLLQCTVTSRVGVPTHGFGETIQSIVELDRMVVSQQTEYTKYHFVYFKMVNMLCEFCLNKKKLKVYLFKS